MCRSLIEQGGWVYLPWEQQQEQTWENNPISGFDHLTVDKHEQGREILFWKQTLTGLDLAEGQTLLPHSQHCVCSQDPHNLRLPVKPNKYSEVVTLMQKNRVGTAGLLARYEERLQGSCLNSRLHLKKSGWLWHEQYWHWMVAFKGTAAHLKAMWENKQRSWKLHSPEGQDEF